jgi:hypothetical protein
MPEDILRKETCEVDQPHGHVVLQLRQHVSALEKELANYGSKYGFTESARALLSERRGK